MALQGQIWRRRREEERVRPGLLAGQCCSDQAGQTVSHPGDPPRAFCPHSPTASACCHASPCPWIPGARVGAAAAAAVVAAAAVASHRPAHRPSRSCAGQRPASLWPLERLLACCWWWRPCTQTRRRCAAVPAAGAAPRSGARPRRCQPPCWQTEGVWGRWGTRWARPANPRCPAPQGAAGWVMVGVLVGASLVAHLCADNACQ